MTNVIIFYWVPGSCGDFVQSVLLANSTDYQGVVKQFSLNSKGRIVPKIDDIFKAELNFQPNPWLIRKWSANDCQKIKHIINLLNCKNYVIPTHSLEQVDYLKSQFINCKTMGITYPKNMFPLVLKNWCKKVTEDDDSLSTIYSDSLHQYFKKKGVFGEFMLLEQLTYQSDVPVDVACKFDINLSLENLFNCDLSIFHRFIDKKQLEKINFKLWFQKQNQLYCYSLDNLHPILKESLGYNSLTRVPAPLDLKLDLFDNILIKEYCRVKTNINLIPSFTNLGEANNFFTNATC